MGKAFKAIREKVFLISKSGVSWHSTKRVNMTNDPKETQKMLENSLRDLQSEYIDLYMIHWPDANVDIRRPMEVLAKAKLEGKIKHLGLCNTYDEDLARAQEVERIEVVQGELNLFNHEVVDRMFPLLGEQNIEYMGWGTFDKGILTGRVKKGRTYDKSDARSWAPWWKKSDVDKKVEVMERILPEIEKSGHTPVELAIGFALSFDPSKMCICGVRNREQLASTIQAFDHLPSQEFIESIGQKVKEQYGV